LLGLLAVLLGWANAVPVGAGQPAKIPVAASIVPLADFCRQIGGDRVAVSVLIPPGASPHVFEPSPAAVAGAMKARVFVYVGAGLDPWAERLVQARRLAPDSAVVRAVTAVPPGEALIRDVITHRHEEQENSHKPGAAEHRRAEEQVGIENAHVHEEGNPHVWLDPVLAQNLCRLIASALIQVDPQHRDRYEANLAGYVAELETLHREIQGQVAGFRLREFVSFHPAFSYFARRYGLKEAGVIEAAPGREPTPGHLRRLVGDIRKSGVKAVFAEPQLSPRVAEIIAREAGAQVLILDPLGGRPPYGSDYLKLMRHNLAVLTKAMQ
jgi:ABC-type Zn uptake system ZnuABC Zn-binding protein ZnuA